MNGTLKSLLAVAALWMGSVVAWSIVVGLAAAFAGRGMGAALTVAMVTAWGCALLFALAVVAAAKPLIWKWMTEKTGRVLLLLLATGVMLATFSAEALSVFVIFNR